MRFIGLNCIPCLPPFVFASLLLIGSRAPFLKPRLAPQYMYIYLYICIYLIYIIVTALLRLNSSVSSKVLPLCVYTIQLIGYPLFHLITKVLL